MSLKKFLIPLLLLSLVIFIYFSGAVVDSFHALTAALDVTRNLILVLILAALLQISGHIVRARKTELLFSATKPNTTRFQFRALSIGYLFNTLLPFHLGELIRARIIAGGMDISFSFALMLIIVERAFDVLLLGVIGLVILLTAVGVPASVFIYVATLFVVAAIVFSGVGLLVKQNTRLLHWMYRSSAIFRRGIRNSMRFKMWSVIYGLQRTLHPRILMRYVGLSLGAWVLYGASVFVLVQYLFTETTLGNKLLLTVAPYFGVGIPAGPANLGVFSRATNAVSAPVHLGATDLLIYNLLSWAILVLPIAAIGLALLLTKTKETLWRKVPQTASAAALANKLQRREDISQEMARFLENYFSGNTLSRIVHRLELQDNFRLMRYFKGGSDAITILARQDGRDVVKKIIPPEFEDRLKAQYDWLTERRECKGIVRALREERTNQYYAIDLEYRSEDVMLFDFMHQNPLTKSQKVMDEVWGYLFKYVYGNPGRIKEHAKERTAYINKHIFGCLEKAASVNPDLLRAAEPEKLIINGHVYDNLYQVLEKIKRHPHAWKDIATYRETTAVHGDVAVDNILVSGKDGKALLIDPAPDGNIINGPVFDFGKNMQSLHCGYEFLLRDEDPVYLTGDGDTINYREHSSAQYTKLCTYVRQKLAPRHLSESEQRAIIFHAAALHIRRLKHQVYYNPDNALKFYAVGVKTFNDFLAQYE